MFVAKHNRSFPAVMATQHPDNAGTPFWHDSPVVSEYHEVDELFQNFSVLGADEYMWDWEGKFADEGMIEKLVSKYREYFVEHQIGRDVQVTLRIPNIWEEQTFKLARAYMTVLSAADFAHALGAAVPPVFELILPMTKRADQLSYIQDTFAKLARFKQEVFDDGDVGDGMIHMVPIFESVEDLTGAAGIVREYLSSRSASSHGALDHLRVFLARSDPALNAGLVPAALSCRIALRDLALLSAESGIVLAPIIGCGSLPFRGGLTPDDIPQALQVYAGARTLTVQSAFRYDYPLETVQRAISDIQSALPNTTAPVFDDDERKRLLNIVQVFQAPYRQSVEALAPWINELARNVPARRSRVQHVGLFGYSRGVGSARLPRAIGFTAALYSIGLPPEFIGTGRALRELHKRGELAILEDHLPVLRSWLLKAGRLSNIANLQQLLPTIPALADVIADIQLAADVLGLDFEPSSVAEQLHHTLTSAVFLKGRAGLDPSFEIVEAARLRQSLG